VAPCGNVICFVQFLFVGGFSFVKDCRKHACICLEIEHVFIVLQDWTLLGTPIKVYEFVLPCICWHDFTGPSDPY